MAALETLRIGIEANTKEAQRGFQEIVMALSSVEHAIKGNSRGFREYSDTVKKTESAHREFAKWVKGTATEINSVMSIIGRLGGALGQVFDAVEDAARTNAAKAYFEEAGRSLQELRKASGGLVSDASLLKKSNLADSMGLGQDTFKTLITVAQAAAAKTGQSFDYMFDSIVTGTARSSRLLLDNLGIIINVKDSNRQYAKELIDSGQVHGKTIEQVIRGLTAQGKQQAFLNGLQEASKGQLEELAKVGLGGGAVFDRWAAATANLKDSLVRELLPGLKSVLGVLTQIVEAWNDSIALREKGTALFNKSGMADELDTKGGEDAQGSARVPGLGAFAPDYARFGNVPSGNEVANKMFREGGFYTEAKKRFEDLLYDMNVLLIKEQQLPVTDFSTMLKASSYELNRHGEGLLEVNPEIALMAKNLAAANAFLELFRGKKEEQALDRAGDVDFSGSGSAGGGSKEQKLTDSHQEEMQARQRLYDDMLKNMAELEKIQEAGAQKLEKETSDAFYQMRKDHDKIAELDRKRWEEEAKYLKDAQERAEKAQKAAQEDFDQRGAAGVNFAAGLVSGDAGSFVQVLATGIGTLMGGPGIGAAIGNLLAPFADSLEGLSAIVKALFEGFGKMVEVLLGPIFDALAPLAPSLYSLMVAVGILVAGFIRPLVRILAYLVPIIGLIVDVVSFLLIVLSGFAEIIGSVIAIFYSFLAVLAPWIADYATAGNGAQYFAETLRMAGDYILSGAVEVRNGFYKLIRSMPGMGDFGGKNWKLDVDDVRPDWGSFDSGSEGVDLPGLSEDQVIATKENTEALRDLARELHNLPAGYRGLAAIWASSQVENPRLPGNSGDIRTALPGAVSGPVDPRKFNPSFW